MNAVILKSFPSGPAVSQPPANRARSRMPGMPLPVPDALVTELSSDRPAALEAIWTASPGPLQSRCRVTEVPERPCFRALVRDSWTIRKTASSRPAPNSTACPEDVWTICRPAPAMSSTNPSTSARPGWGEAEPLSPTPSITPWASMRAFRAASEIASSADRTGCGRSSLPRGVSRQPAPR